MNNRFHETKIIISKDHLINTDEDNSDGPSQLEAIVNIFIAKNDVDTTEEETSTDSFDLNSLYLKL